MRQDLEDLWNYYLIEDPIQINKKEDLLIRDYSKKVNKFRSILTDEQNIFLNEYDSAISEINRINERHAFIKGVTFATRFIFQAMSDK